MHSLLARSLAVGLSAAASLVASAGAQDDVPKRVAKAIEASCRTDGARVRIAVFPFELEARMSTQPRFSRGGDTVAKWFAETLRGPGAEVFEGVNLARRLVKANRPVESYDPRLAPDFAAAAGMSHAVYGALIWSDQRLLLEVRVVDVSADDGNGAEVFTIETDLGGTTNWTERFGGKLAEAFRAKSRQAWGVGGVYPDWDPELPSIGRELCTLLADGAGAALNGKRIGVVAVDRDGACSQLTADLQDFVREGVGQLGAQLVDLTGFERLLNQVHNRNTWLWRAWMCTNDREFAAAALRAAGLDAVVWIDVRDRKNDTFSLALEIIDGSHPTCRIPGFTIGRVPELGRYLADRSQLDRQPLTAFVPDPRSELFLSIRRAALRLAGEIGSTLASGATVGLGGLRLAPRRAADDVLDRFRKSVTAWRAARENQFREMASLAERRRQVLDHVDALAFDGRIYATLRQAEGALARMELDALKSGSTGDLEDLQSKLQDSLAQCGITFVAGSDDVDRLFDRQRLLEDVADLFGEPMPLPALDAPDYLIDAHVRDEGAATGLVLTVWMLDVRNGRRSKPVEVPMLPECRAGILDILRAASELAVQVPEPDPRLLIALDRADRNSDDGARPARQRLTENVERFLEARVGNVVYGLGLAGGKVELFRAGTCFAVQVGGRGVLVTNRHVVHTNGDAEQYGGPEGLIVQTRAFTERQARLWVHFPRADGTTDAFEARVVGWSPDSDLAILEDHRADKVYFEIADPAGVQLGDPLLISGYPGIANDLRGLTPKYRVPKIGTDGNPVLGDDGRPLLDVVEALITDDPRDAHRKIDVFVTRGALNSYVDPSPPRTSARGVVYDASTFGGNSGGPVLTTELRVFGVHAWGGVTAKNPINGGLVLAEHVIELERILGVGRGE